MRSFKKVLTLALVFAMAIGLLTAGALNFTDADDIQYKTAVEVMTNLGAINGYTDGTFRPDGLVTRAEAAKLVTYAILTPKVAEMLPKGTSSFTDVPATHWAAPYIEYCVSQGIINGKGAGKFDPNGNVTGLELAKMLLVAAGYGRNNEYVGSNWALKVAIDAIDHNIFEGSKQTNYSVPATREEAALYVFNGLTKVAQVKYSKDTETYELVNDDEYTIGKQKYGLDDVTSTVNGVTGYTWLSNGKPVSSFIVAENVLGTSMDGIAIADLHDKYGDYFIAELDASVAYFYNGFEATAYATGKEYAAGEYIVNDGKVYKVVTAIAKEDNTAFTAVDTTVVADPKTKGVIVNFVDGNYNGKADKIAIVKKTVAVVGADPVANKGKVEIKNVTTGEVDVKYVPGYENLAKDDVVLFYVDPTGTYNIELAESVQGTVTAVAGSKYYIDGVAFEKSELDGTTVNNPVLGSTDSTYYLDNAGYIVHITGPVQLPTLYEYALVLDYRFDPANSWTDTAASSKAKLLLADGTVGVFDLVTNRGKAQNDALGKGDLIKYIMNDNGKITTVIDKDDKVEGEDTPYFKKADNVTVTAKSVTVELKDTTHYISANTVFFYYDVDEDEDGNISIIDYGVAVGYNNAQTTASAVNGVYYEANAKNVVQAMAVPYAYVGVTGPASYAYLYNATPVQTLEVINGQPTTVYTYDVFVNGEATTIKTTDDTAFTVGLYSVAESNGYYELTPKTLGAAVEVAIAESTYFVANNTLYNITKDTEIYKATLNASGAVTKLEEADFTLVPSKTLKASVLATSGTAQYVIFWYE